MSGVRHFMSCGNVYAEERGSCFAPWCKCWCHREYIETPTFANPESKMLVDPPKQPQHRRFILQRDEDETGISGTGVVAEGIEFSDGRIALRWMTGEHRSTVLWESIESVEAIHGHGGKTRVVWL